MEESIARQEAEFWARAQRHLLKYGGEFVAFVPVRAEGAFLYDAGGRRVLDFTSGQMSALLGHSHRECADARAERQHRAHRCVPGGDANCPAADRDRG